MHGSGVKQCQLNKGVTTAIHSCKTSLSIMLSMLRAVGGHRHRSMDEIRLIAMMRKQSQSAYDFGDLFRAAIRHAIEQQATDASSNRRRAVAIGGVKTHETQFQ